MRLHLISAGTRMPPWVVQGFDQFATRLPPECSLQLHEIPLGRRSRNTNPLRAREDEGRRMLAAVPKNARVIALDVTGRGWSTEQLAAAMQDWLQDGRDLALLVGGPEGLAPACVARAELRWSLSPLTFPHMLVRLIVAEQLYRAWSLLKGHPYHRA
ncbi:MAG TPA: 23S rRNA (pseudouridine(1915)-N(3))-methyltransferase RlmH [Gammaproteobacteria bacterium]|nr:23S rRNA (pseudouridine(1915)-N(3))-methyltransferase RlmH [Gammaproteobacteria bacterium]